MLGRRRNDVDVLHRFLAAADTAGHGRGRHPRLRAEQGGNLLRQRPGIDQQELALKPLHVIYPGEDAFLGLGAEPRQRYQAVLAAGVLQLAHRIDAQLFVELQRLLRPQAGNLHQLEQHGRHRCLQLVVIRQSPGGEKFADLLADGLADALGSVHPAAGHELRQVAVKLLQNPCRRLVRPDFERIVPLERQQHGDIGKNQR